MQKTKPKAKSPRFSKSRPKTPRPKPKSVEDVMAEHLKQAEHHLIEAINLFSGPKKVVRRVGYYTRLISAQETITTLYREELVRIRGPLSKRGKK